MSERSVVAYKAKDYQKMYDLARILLDKLPRQQVVYDLQAYCMKKLGKTDELPALLERIDLVNAIQNPLCHYLPRETTIGKPKD